MGESTPGAPPVPVFGLWYTYMTGSATLCLLP